jgi:hypothetical protein
MAPSESQAGRIRFSQGNTVTVAIDGIGELTNEFRQKAAAIVCCGPPALK